MLILQVGTVTADNASNVLAAFKIAKIDVDNNEDLIYEDELEISDNEEYGDSDLEDFDNTAEETVLQVDMTTERNGCLLQLAIKDAFSECEFASQLLRKVNQVVNYFHRSNFWYTRLRETVGDLSLLKPCTTRWNSQFHCLKRIFGENRQEVHLFYRLSFTDLTWCCVFRDI